MTSRERDVDEPTRDDSADQSSEPGRTRTIDRTRDAASVHGNGDTATDAAGDVPTELIPAIDPLLPPIERPHGNGDTATDEQIVEEAGEPEIPDVELRVTEPVPDVARTTPTPAPAAVAITPAIDDASGPMAVITRRATVVGAERHLVAPVHRAVGRRPRVRKVTRVVRHVDPWTMFKVAAVFSAVVYGVLLTAGVLLWNVASTTGTVDNVERFFESFGWTEFEFDGGQIYHAAWIAGLFGAVALTGFAVLGATLFNLITDLVGGIRLTVLEEEVVEKTASPMRRFTVRRTETDLTPHDGQPYRDT